MHPSISLLLKTLLIQLHVEPNSCFPLIHQIADVRRVSVIQGKFPPLADAKIKFKILRRRSEELNETEEQISRAAAAAAVARSF